MEWLSLAVPAFLAGLLTFFAPCTLPLVPAFLSFIGGSAKGASEHPTRSLRLQIVVNALFYVFGFGVVFVVLGTLFGLGGAVLVHYRLWLSRVGGVFVMLFGLMLLGVFRSRAFLWLEGDHRFSLTSSLVPGRASSAFLLGATFAFGWTPCVGPILGSVLLLASTRATAGSGALLLSLFAIGLGVPFLLLALSFGHAAQTVKRLTKWLPVISRIGGVFLLFLGVLLVTDMMEVWMQFVYRIFAFISYDKLLQWL